MSISYYLIISQSGRSLAAATKLAGYECLVIDQFADQDTQLLAEAFIKVPVFNDESLPVAIQTLQNRYSIKGIVIGSGFEQQPDLINIIGQQLPVFGNTVETLKMINNPKFFFSELQQRDLTFPVTIFDPDEIDLTQGQWLRKCAGQSGGQHVAVYDPNLVWPDGNINQYYQARVFGENRSCVFLANGQEAYLVGINRTWVEANSFKFAGAVTQNLQKDHTRGQLKEILDQLVVQFSLKGVCGLDYILCRDKIVILEINARPTASVELYDHSECSLFKAHLDACHGELPVCSEFVPQADKARAKLILYAETRCMIPQIEWPAWVSDIPATGSEIALGSPICSVYAEGKTADSATKIVHNRRRELYWRLIPANAGTVQ